MKARHLLAVLALAACSNEMPTPPAKTPKAKAEAEAIPMPAAAPVAAPASAGQDAKPVEPEKK